jgi:hypothetical protein
LPSIRLEKSQVESSEHQDNADVHHQPFPESVSEELEIDADDDGRHRHHVKQYNDPSVHFGSMKRRPSLTDAEIEARTGQRVAAGVPALSQGDRHHERVSGRIQGQVPCPDFNLTRPVPFVRMAD